MPIERRGRRAVLASRRWSSDSMQKLGADSCDRDFVLLEELHRSAGGSVYRAKHKSSGTEVVIKERTSAELGGKGRDAMRHELKLYERLSPHPNVIGLLGAFWRGGDAASSSGGYGAGDAMPHGARSPGAWLGTPGWDECPPRASHQLPWQTAASRSAASHPPTFLPSLTPGARLAMVFEYAEQGDMHRFLEAQRATGKYLSERQALSLFRQVAAGTYHLHANGEPQSPLPPPAPRPTLTISHSQASTSTCSLP